MIIQFHSILLRTPKRSLREEQVSGWVRQSPCLPSHILSLQYLPASIWRILLHQHIDPDFLFFFNSVADPDRVRFLSLWLTMDISKMSRGEMTLFGSACCSMLTMHFTVQLLSQHLFYWKNPKEHKAIIIIILMAPIYAIDLFVGLLDF